MDKKLLIVIIAIIAVVAVVIVGAFTIVSTLNDANFIYFNEAHVEFGDDYQIYDNIPQMQYGASEIWGNGSVYYRLITEDDAINFDKDDLMETLKADNDYANVTSYKLHGKIIIQYNVPNKSKDTDLYFNDYVPNNVQTDHYRYLIIYDKNCEKLYGLSIATDSPHTNLYTQEVEDMIESIEFGD